jgi:hypothetical protein
MFKFKFKGLENPHPRTTFVAFKLIIREKDVCGKVWVRLQIECRAD